MTTGANLDQVVGQLAGRAGAVAICLDVDGTIAPIGDDPQLAVRYPGVLGLLGSLADRYAAVALISGGRRPFWPTMPSPPASATWHVRAGGDPPRPAGGRPAPGTGQTRGRRRRCQPA